VNIGVWTTSLEKAADDDEDAACRESLSAFDSGARKGWKIGEDVIAVKFARV
jgi:hypothetical protein